MNPSDTIRIFLRDCRVDLRVGIHLHEREKPQPVIVNVEIEMPLAHHYRELAEDKFDRTINYELIYRFVHADLPKRGHIPLLETIAELIMDFCFTDARVRAARVRLEKPHIFGSTGGAGIEMQRIRKE